MTLLHTPASTGHSPRPQRSDAHGLAASIRLPTVFGLILMLVAGMLAASETSAADPAADPSTRSEHYRVTTLQAAPGKLRELLALFARESAENRWAARGEAEPMLMRHSQGDHWDLLVLQPVGRLDSYFAEPARSQRAAAGGAEFEAARDALVVFREDLFALGPARALVEAAYRNNGFFHIEMFHAHAGKHAELLHQRRIENDYLTAVGIPANLIWVSEFGSDVDVFTIGFYPSIVEYAAPIKVSADAAEAAAKAAGFEGRAYIGTYLRELLARHHDTLAVKP